MKSPLLPLGFGNVDITPVALSPLLIVICMDFHVLESRCHPNLDASAQVHRLLNDFLVTPAIIAMVYAYAI